MFQVCSLPPSEKRMENDWFCFLAQYFEFVRPDLQKKKEKEEKENFLSIRIEIEST